MVYRSGLAFAVIPASNIALGADYVAGNQAVAKEAHGCIYLKVRLL